MSSLCPPISLPWVVVTWCLCVILAVMVVVWVCCGQWMLKEASVAWLCERLKYWLQNVGRVRRTEHLQNNTSLNILSANTGPMHLFCFYIKLISFISAGAFSQISACLCRMWWTRCCWSVYAKSLNECAYMRAHRLNFKVWLKHAHVFLSLFSLGSHDHLNAISEAFSRLKD